MKPIRFITLASLSLLTLNLTGAVKAQTSPFTAASNITANKSGGTDAVNAGLYAPHYGISHRTSASSLNVEGAAVLAGDYDGFFAVRYDTTNIKNQIAANFGATPYDIVSIALVIQESNAAFTAPGNVVFYLASDNTTEFGYKYFDSAAADKQEVKTDPFGPASTVGTEEVLEVFPFTSAGATPKYPIDTVPLLGSANGAAVRNPTNPAAAADLLAAFNSSSNRLTIVGRAQDADLGNIPATPTVAATFNGSGFTSAKQPQLVVVAIKHVVATAPPAAPVNVIATASNGQVALSWTGSANANSYNVYRATTPGGEGATPVLTGITTTSINDTNLTNGTTYYYQITAVNSAGESPRAGEVNATPFLASPVLSVAVVSGQIQLSFTASSGAVSYTLSRSTTSGTETPYITGLVGTAFTDTAAAIGATYYYTVTAINAAGSSVPSNQVSATKASAVPFTAFSAAYGNNAMSSDLLNGAMYAPHFGTTHRTTPNSLNVEGSGVAAGDYDGFFALRFDLTNLKSQLAANFGGATNYTVQSITLALTENNQGFTAPGNVVFNLSSDNATDFGYHFLSAASEVTADPFTPTTALAGEELLEVFPFPTTGTTTNFTVDNVPLYGTGVQNPTNSNAGADLLAAFNNTANKLTIVGRAQDSAIGSIAATPLVAATFNGNAFQGYSQPQLVITAIAATVAPVTISGTVSLEGVSFPHTGGIALDPITVAYYPPASGAHDPANPLATQRVAINPADGSFSFTPALAGSYDLAFKTLKSLRVIQTSVNTAAAVTGDSLSLTTGDSNNDNSVDSTDFGNLIGAFNTSVAVPGNGYDPTVDFNYDGSVDSTDFGLLIGDYNTVGAP